MISNLQKNKTVFSIFTFCFIVILLLINADTAGATGFAMGRVYCDENRNGEIDWWPTPDPVLEGIVVNIESHDGTFFNFGVTDSDGNFLIELPADPASYRETIDETNIPFIEYMIPSEGFYDIEITDTQNWSWNQWLIYIPSCSVLAPPGTGTPGFWKNHPLAWPVDSITVCGTPYSKKMAINILSLPVKGDKTITMFKALVAAKLNVLAGNDDSCIADVIAAADNWMCAHPVGSGVSARSHAWKQGEPLYTILDAYNNGELCAKDRDNSFNDYDSNRTSIFYNRYTEWDDYNRYTEWDDYNRYTEWDD